MSLIFKRFLVTKLLIKKKYEILFLHLETGLKMLLKIDVQYLLFTPKIALMKDIVFTYRMYRFPVLFFFTLYRLLRLAPRNKNKW